MSNTGPLGKKRNWLGVLGLTVITFGIYNLVWTFKTQEEIKRHSGEGVGGWVGLIISLVIGFVTPFLIPQEIRKMIEKDGKTSPVSGKTGLWMIPGAFLIVPIFIWYSKVQGALNDYWDAKASEGASTPAPAA